MVRIGFHQHVFETNLIRPKTPSTSKLSGPWGQPPRWVSSLQPNAWHCVETFFNGAQHELRVWLDGDGDDGPSRDELERQPVQVASPQYAKAWFGFETYHGEQAELWYDDLIIGTQPIGCGG